MTTFTLRRDVAAPFDEVVALIREELGQVGFGVLTEIDLAATLKTKLDVDIPRQLILGACRPQLAEQAVKADPRIAALLPCNVVVADEGDSTRVEIFDPKFMTSFAQAPELDSVAADAQQRFQTVLDKLG